MRGRMTVPTGLRQARLATTVLLLRDVGHGLEVWTQQRAATMRHFAGVTVFPGGGVDLRDFPDGRAGPGPGPGELWTGTPAHEFAERLSMSPGQAHAVVLAAVRELFEETGTLLAVHADGTEVADASPYHADRLALASHRLSLTDMLHSRNLRIRSGLLHPWARWVGGDDERHWFDNSAFLAVAPTGQSPDGNSSEVARAHWSSPGQLLEGWRRGLIRLAIPTWAQLSALADCADVDAALRLARASELTPVIGDPVEDPRYREYFAAARPDRHG